MREDVVGRFSRVEQELHQERAAALGRIGGTLAELIAKLGSLQSAARVASAEDRARLGSEYRDIWDRARTYRWYLEVQREAVGLRRHDRLDEMYPIPPRSL